MDRCDEHETYCPGCGWGKKSYYFLINMTNHSYDGRFYSQGDDEESLCSDCFLQALIWSSHHPGFCRRCFSGEGDEKVYVNNLEVRLTEGSLSWMRHTDICKKCINEMKKQIEAEKDNG